MYVGMRITDACASARNMTSDELGYEKVKPRLASPGKHFATSTVHKLAERLGIGNLGNGMIKPAESNRTVICNPATRVNHLNFTDSKLGKKSKKKKKSYDDRKERTSTSTKKDNEKNNKNIDDGGKKKKSKKKKKDKKEKKKAKHKERESGENAKDGNETADSSIYEIELKPGKKPKASKASKTKNFSETSTKCDKIKGNKWREQKKKFEKHRTNFRKKLMKQSSRGGQGEDKNCKKNKITQILKRQKERDVEERRKRKKETQESADAKKKKRRSMLDELRNSDGYVAEKRFKKHEDLFADPSQLGREERALQVKPRTLCYLRSMFKVNVRTFEQCLSVEYGSFLFVLLQYRPKNGFNLP